MVLLEASQQPNVFANTPVRRTAPVIDGRLPSLDRLPEHRKLLERAVARLRDDARVVGLVAGGSLAHGGADFFSDVDLYIVVRDETFDEIFAERDVTMEAVGSPLFGFVIAPVPGGSTDHIVIYEGPVKFDFMYLKESDLKPDPKWAGCLVLNDASGRVEAVKTRSEGLTPTPPSADALLDLNQKFWIWCWYVFGKIVRGELWEALDGLHSIRSLALVPLLDWEAKRPQEGYRRLERKTDPATASRLVATVAPVQPEALYAALQAEMELFRILRAKVFDRHGLTFDPTPEEVLESEMSRRWVAREAQ
jgi:predicted nucleotidyltransferase